MRIHYTPDDHLGSRYQRIKDCCNHTIANAYITAERGDTKRLVALQIMRDWGLLPAVYAQLAAYRREYWALEDEIARLRELALIDYDTYWTPLTVARQRRFQVRREAEAAFGQMFFSPEWQNVYRVGGPLEERQRRLFAASRGDRFDADQDEHKQRAAERAAGVQQLALFGGAS